jgi:hypothetical protein
MQARHVRPFRPLRRVAVAVGVAVFAVGAAIAGPGAVDSLFQERGPAAISHVPGDNPELGMVYHGLTPAKKGQPCVGGYQLTESGQCSHGPDVPPTGLNVRVAAKPVAGAVPQQNVPAVDAAAAPQEQTVLADDGAADGAGGGFAVVPDAAAADGTASFTIGLSGVACDGDGVSGKRVQVLYARDAKTPSRFGEYRESFRTWSAGVDAIFNASAKETGGERHVRFVTTPDCKVDVREVELPAGALNDFGSTINGVRKLGYDRSDRKYMIFADSNVYCGIGTFAGDSKPGADNRSNSGPSFGRTDTGCWSAGVAAHELGHNLGAVNNNAPNSSKAGHCLDEYDLMCYGDSGGLKTNVKCADRAHDDRFDCNHDDYYNTNPKPGSYLANNWNMANSQFLIAGGGTTPPPPSPTASPSPTKTGGSPSPTKTGASPSPTKTSPSPSKSVTPTPTKPPTGLKELRISDVGATSVRLSWDAAPAGSRYAIVLNGQSIGQVHATGVRVVGMRPGTDYQIGVSLTRNGMVTPWTNTVKVHTTSTQPPAAGQWLVFGNSLTGGAVDVFGARSAAGTPIIIYRRHDGANQQWKLEPAANGVFLVRSKATDKCLTTVDNVDSAGATLVQEDCAKALQWKTTKTDYGFAITTPGGLVVGVSRIEYFGSRLLVLQNPSSAKYQSWIPHSG